MSKRWAVVGSVGAGWAVGKFVDRQQAGCKHCPLSSHTPRPSSTLWHFTPPLPPTHTSAPHSQSAIRKKYWALTKRHLEGGGDDDDDDDDDLGELVSELRLAGWWLAGEDAAGGLACCCSIRLCVLEVRRGAAALSLGERLLLLLPLLAGWPQSWTP